MSSVWVPVATTVPPSISATRSASASVDGLCTTRRAVTPSRTVATHSSHTASHGVPAPPAAPAGGAGYAARAAGTGRPAGSAGARHRAGATTVAAVATGP